MHGFGYRLNSLLTYVTTILALMCAVAFFSDKFSLPSPNAQLQVVKINRFRRGPSGKDEISLWYHRIPSRDRAIGQTQTKVMYPLTDQGDHLRGKYFNLTSHWHVMPKVGRMIADEIVMPAIFSLPKDIVNV